MGFQDFCKSIGNGGCLATVYVRATLGDKATPTMMFDALWQAAKFNIIDANDDCYVKDAVALMSLVNPSKSYTVKKESISTIQGLDLAAVCYEYNGFNHWVLVEKGQIVFDSLDDSKCVKYGVPSSARIIKMEDK